MSSPKPKIHLVIGKIYSNGCIHCVMMKKAWDEMIATIQKDLNLVLETETHDTLKQYKKYASNDGKRVVEVIEIEGEHMDDELPYLRTHYSDTLALQGGFPTIFKIRNNVVSYYNGERTAKKMKEWYSSTKMSGGRSTRRRQNRKNKTKKNKTRYSR